MGHLVRLSYPEAPNGSFSATTVGGAASAAIFSDPECQTVDTNRTLSALGRGRFYLKAPAVVAVFDVNGVSVDGPFTEGSRAELTGVYSPYFTGTLPNGTQGLGGYQSLLDTFGDLATSFGSVDGKVKETGQSSSLLLKDALAGIRQANLPYYNVKSAPYNAVGDGVAIDSGAIQAAINAATAAGGGVVYLPRGSYLCPTGLSLSGTNGGKVSLLGDGASSVIVYTAGSGYAITMAGGGEAGNSIRSLRIDALNAGGLLLQVTNNSGYFVTGCELNASDPGAISIATSMVIAENKIFSSVVTANRGFIEITGTSPAVTVANNIAPSAITQLVRVLVGATGPTVVVSGNALSATNTAMAVLATSGTFSVVSSPASSFAFSLEAGCEACNFYEAGSGVILNNTAGILTGKISSASRQRSATLATGTSVTPNTSEDNAIDINGTPVAINAPLDSAWDGAKLVLRMRNTTGAPAVMNYNATYLQGGAVPGNLAAGATRVSEYVRRSIGTTPGWRLKSSQDST